MGDSSKKISCSLSQIYLADKTFLTFSFTKSGNPSKMKSIDILLFLFNSFLFAIFGFFVAMYPINNHFQLSLPHSLPLPLSHQPVTCHNIQLVTDKHVQHVIVIDTQPDPITWIIYQGHL